MKAAFVEKSFKTALKEINRPQVGDTEVLIKVSYAGICGSDLHIYKGAHAFRKPPVILGHELSGIVVEIGKEVKKIAVGDKVTVLPQKSCHQCRLCQEGHQQHCESKIVPGTNKWIGSFVEYFNAEEEVVYKLDNTIGLETGVLAEPLAVSVHALNKIRPDHRKNLLILGGGTIGILTLVAAKNMGFEKIILTDVVDYNLEVARKNKADRVINVLNEDIGKAVLEEFGDVKANAVIVTAAAPNILEQAINNVGVARTIVYISMITEPLTFDTYPIVYKEIHLVGSLTYNEEDFKEALRLLSSDAFNYERLITHVYNIDDVQEAFEMIENKKEGFVKVLIKV